MYRTFKKFERDHPDKYLDTDKKRKDNIENKNNGYRFRDSEDNDVVLYSKISVIENLLEAYDDLSLDVIERQIGINENIDYAQIDKYLDKAIYQEETNDEHVIYIDSMNLPRNVIQYKSATLIDMFCFILDELNKELDQETDSRVRELSSKFKEQYLSYDQSLFKEDTFEETIIILKDLLQSIDRATAYKDNDYWQLYEAIESFLYGELDMNNVHLDGVFWGISSFWPIWEDMCNVFAIKNFHVLYIDTKINIKNKLLVRCNMSRTFISTNFTNLFYLTFGENLDKRRWLRPDVIRSCEQKWILPDITINIVPGNDTKIDLKISNKATNKKYYYAVCNTFKNFSDDCKASKSNDYMEFKGCDKKEFDSFLKKEHKKEYIEYIYVLDWKYKDISVFLSKNDSVDIDIT
jgi:hypothetical protein